MSTSKCAFDTVDRGSLWILEPSLQTRDSWRDSFPDFGALHQHGYCYKDLGDFSHFFPVRSGVRQGCLLAPTVFNTFAHWVMEEKDIKLVVEYLWGESHDD